ncbi:protein timeless-like [Elysia marginata]|uniref:Protein timeless-like n=1 Tax=Elysia marginata TaxID=1093978 RepID=A0AAV4IR00_9GAST|nr:protein timeless-like [Elysia marginata]
MFITETWIREKGDEPVITSLTPPKYSYEPFPRSSGKGGGIGILYKNSLSSVLHFADKKQPVVTFETAIATLSISTRKITFVCIYRPPPSKNNKLKTSDFLCEFEEFLSSYDIKNKDTVFLGDFNVHFETENPDAIFMKNLLHDHQMIQHVKSKTHKKGHILDWIITSSKLKLSSQVANLNKLISDHHFLYFDIMHPKRVTKKKTIVSRDFKKIDMANKLHKIFNRSTVKRTEDDASIHDQVLWAMHASGLEDLILYVASSDRERSHLCMHVMEIIALIFKEQEPETLASAGVHRSLTEKEKDQRELEQAREREKAQKKANILKFSGRHSRFGGTFVLKDIKSISENDVIYHKPLCEVKRFSYDEGKNRKKISRNRAPIKTDDPKRRSTLSMRLSLKEFCIQFLINAYNPLMRAVKDALTRKSTQDNDETFYLWAMRFFMEFCRLHCKRVDFVSETMSMSAFHYIYTQLCTYYESVRLGKGEECKVWGRRSHLALKAYQELLRTLDFMSRCEDEQIRESAKVIQSNVFYMMEYRDVFVTLLKNFKESQCSRAYLRDLVESTHIFLKMLETFTKKNKNLVVQKKKKKRNKKKSKTTPGM